MSNTGSSLEKTLSRLDTDFDASVERLFELLRIPSISTDSAYKQDCQKAADLLVEDLQTIGFKATAHKTPGHPMVVAHHDGPSEAPHILFYGHYDVQPVDPLELWTTNPFEPSIETRNGSQIITGRGTADDKGQLMTFVEACRAWKKENGALPCRVTLLFEGEEESGSPSMIPFLEAHRDELSCDVALVCDTNMWDEETPAIATSLRGMYKDELTIKAADRDLHSGYYGGAAANPIHVLNRILADLHDDKGRVTLDGFYDDVPETPPHILEQWAKLDMSAERFLGDVGLSQPSGEKDRSVLELIWARPTAEVNGITGGYTGEGFKTVIAAEASAKISFRLVGDQDPQKIQDAFHAHVKARLPDDCEAVFTESEGAPGINLPHDSAFIEQSKIALTEEWPNAALTIGMGGSIPIVGHFNAMLNMPCVLAGFGLGDDQIHSPNEKYNLSSFQKGQRSWARVLDRLSKIRSI